MPQKGAQVHCCFIYLLMGILACCYGQEDRSKLFTSGSPWGNTITQSTNIADFTAHSIGHCSYNCIKNQLCHAYTYGGLDSHRCTLHDKLLQVDYNAPVAREGAIYYQRDLRSCQAYLVSGESFNVPNSALSASTNWNACHGVARSRLNTRQLGTGCSLPSEPQLPGCWASKIVDLNQWIGVDLGVLRYATGVTTQGRHSSLQRVTSYAIAYGYDGINYVVYRETTNTDKVFAGNTDQNTHVTNWFKYPFRARHLRILPKTWNEWISLRFDFRGCEI